MATARQMWAFQFFRKEGYSPNGAAAIVGNLSGESGTNLDSTMERGARADHGSGGVAEWRLSRKTELFDFARNLGMDVNGLDVQCMFVIHELQRDYPGLDAQLRSSDRTIENLTANFCFVFERPNKQLARLDNRIEQAKKVLRAAKVSTVAKEVVVAGGTATIGAGAVAGGLNGDEIMAAIMSGGGALAAVFGLWLTKPKKPAETQAAAPPGQSLIEELKALVESRKRADARIEEIVKAVRAQAEEARDLVADLPGATTIEHHPAIGD